MVGSKARMSSSSERLWGESFDKEDTSDREFDADGWLRPGLGVELRWLLTKS